MKFYNGDFIYKIWFCDSVFAGFTLTLVFRAATNSLEVPVTWNNHINDSKTIEYREPAFTKIVDSSVCADEAIDLIDGLVSRLKTDEIAKVLAILDIYSSDSKFLIDKLYELSLEIPEINSSITVI